ncbi:MAG: carbohydrate transporter substrate-binding protein family [Micrococcaceae bacterium]|jgi:multiple sugar transport system substrate-binding protein|nr:carbohydrate transporter substrate-binding protein family [Micrococcaceae bacterium]
MTIIMNRRQFAQAFIGAAGLAALATACGTNNASTSSDGTATLRFTWWGNDLRNKQTQAAIDAFKTGHPNITINAEPGIWASYWDKLATTTAANDSPDIIQMDQAYISEYGGRGALLDLSKQDGLDTSKLEESSLKSGQVNGKQMGISTGQNAHGVMANTKIFEAAGIALPDDTKWTWDEYLAIAAEIAAKIPGNYGSAYGGTDADLNVWLRQNGENLYSEDGNLGASVGSLTSYWERLKKQRDMKAGAPASLASEDVNAAVEQTLFATGKLGMGWWWTNQVAALTSATKSDIKILRAPSQTGKAADNGMYYKASMFWSVSARSKSPKQAVEFINFMLNDEAAGKIILTERGFPGNPDIRAAIASQLSPADKAAGEFLDAIASDIKTTPPVPPVGTGTVQSVIKRYTEDVLFDRTQPKAAAEAFKTEVDGLINSAKK